MKLTLPNMRVLIRTDSLFCMFQNIFRFRPEAGEVSFKVLNEEGAVLKDLVQQAGED